MLQKSSKAKEFVVHRDKVKKFFGETRQSWLSQDDEATIDMEDQLDSRERTPYVVESEPKGKKDQDDTDSHSSHTQDELCSRRPRREIVRPHRYRVARLHESSKTLNVDHQNIAIFKTLSVQNKFPVHKSHISTELCCCRLMSKSFSQDIRSFCALCAESRVFYNRSSLGRHLVNVHGLQGDVLRQHLPGDGRSRRMESRNQPVARFFSGRPDVGFRSTTYYSRYSTPDRSRSSRRNRSSSSSYRSRSPRVTPSRRKFVDEREEFRFRRESPRRRSSSDHYGKSRYSSSPATTGRGEGRRDSRDRDVPCSSNKYKESERDASSVVVRSAISPVASQKEEMDRRMPTIQRSISGDKVAADLSERMDLQQIQGSIEPLKVVTAVKKKHRHRHKHPRSAGQSTGKASGTKPLLTMLSPGPVDSFDWQQSVTVSAESVLATSHVASVRGDIETISNEEQHTIEFNPGDPPVELDLASQAGPAITSDTTPTTDPFVGTESKAAVEPVAGTKVNAVKVSAATPSGED